ncbi:MAG: cell division protein FtsL [Neisseria sp.]|nr:cell division protein FtsL [Neisseria sp.]
MNGLNVLLLVFTLGSGFALITEQNRLKLEYGRLADAQRRQRDLDDAYARLQNEQVKLSDRRKVIGVAGHQGMRMPGPDDTKFVTAGKIRDF